MAARGIISAGGYVPYRRLQRSEIAATFATGGGKGTRSVASYDEDTTTMGVAAARIACRGVPGVAVGCLYFSTVEPAYVDKTNATAIHAALRLDTGAPAFDFGGAARSGVGALRAALAGSGTALVVTSDLRTGLPTGPDESGGGDGAAALLVGDDRDGPVIAELLATGSTTSEFVDRWRTPGDRRSKLWEERFGETQYVPLAEEAWDSAWKAAGLTPDSVDRLAVTGLHSRAVRASLRRLGADPSRVVDDLATTVGNTGTAHPGLLLASALDEAAPGEVIAVVVLADGADVFLFRTTDALAAREPGPSISRQAASGADLPYGKFLSWRQMVAVEPARRPEPARVSSSAARRSEEWKFAFVGSRDPDDGTLHLPPVPGEPAAPMADAVGSIATFTIDRLAYSPSPPIVFAVVDFDGGGRFPLELTDVDADDVEIGTRVEMTFRRIFTADGIHDYFWKARPRR